MKEAPINMSELQQQPARKPKKQKYMCRWESSLYETSRDCPSFGFQDLFDAKVWLESRTRNPLPNTSRSSKPSSCCSLLSPPGRTKRKKNDAITFRLEHREGGALATHQGEERILLYRSDRKGAIAKIIFSSTPSACTADPGGNDGNDTNMAQAKVHVLDVKEFYRGLDMGGLLFSEAMLALRQRYLFSSDNPEQPRQESHNSISCPHEKRTRLPSAVRCELDAEEDVRRHNKLIAFYERFGCTIKPNKRPQFINNNDGETYRKVPMQVDLMAPDHTVSSDQDKKQSMHAGSSSSSSLVGNVEGFLPVLLLGGAENKHGKLSSDCHSSHRRVCWLMTADQRGFVQFRTTKGFLTVDPQGRCSEEDTSAAGHAADHLSAFQLLRVCDSTQCVLSGNNDDGDDNKHDQQKDDLSSSNDKELWILWSPHGTFLTLNPVSQNLEASKTPAFWQADSHKCLSLTCVFDTPTRRQHYRQAWIRQTVEYVVKAKERYLNFKLAQLPLIEALRLVKSIPAFPFRLDSASRGVSLRTLCFHIAEKARKAGEPDWIQFVALIHALGSVVNCIDVRTAIESEDQYDWTIVSKSRVMGCGSSRDATFSEFSQLNTDERDERYKSPTGLYSPHCGIENCRISWSGPEYLYHMLRHNDVDLPDEGFSVLRLFPLYDWHSKNLYNELVNEDDKEILPFVRDFDLLRRQAMQSCSVVEEMTDAVCMGLWTSYYSRLASKFGAENVLDW